MKWLKMRSCWAWGYSRWGYIPLYVEKMDKDTEERVQEMVERENDENAWSDKHRRVEYEVINTRRVPNLKILRICENIEISIEYAKESIIEKTDHLSEIKKLNNKGRKTDPDEIEAAKRDKRHKAAMEEIRKKEA